MLYNGGGTRATYDTDALPAVTAPAGEPASRSSATPHGMQNGAPDGLALVPGTTVVEFLSYEGAMTATNGPAVGLTSTDIGVSENGPVRSATACPSASNPATGGYEWQPRRRTPGARSTRRSTRGRRPAQCDVTPDP